MKKTNMLTKNQETIIGLLHENAQIQRINCSFEVKLDTKVGVIDLPVRIDMRDIEDLCQQNICKLVPKTNKISVLGLVNA